MEYVGHLIHTFVYGASWPAFLLCAIATCAALYAALDATEKKLTLPYREPKWCDAYNRQITGCKQAVIFGVGAAISWGIPAPDFEKERVEVPVRVDVPGPERIVYREGKEIVQQPSSYQTLYDDCTSKMGGTVDIAEANACHTQALQGAGVERILEVRPSPYEEIFRQCNDFAITAPSPQGEQIRNQRLEICHRAALEQSQQRIRAWIPARPGNN